MGSGGKAEDTHHVEAATLSWHSNPLHNKQDHSEMTAAQGTPNRGKGGKSINLIKSAHFFDFSPKLSWGPLDRLKILS